MRTLIQAFFFLMLASFLAANALFCNFVGRQITTYSYLPTTARIITIDQIKVRTRTKRILTYEYSLQEKTYRSSRVRFSFESTNNRHRNAQVGDRIPIFYNPRDPQTSVLEKGLNAWDRAAASFISALDFLACVFLQAIFRARKIHPPAGVPLQTLPDGYSLNLAEYNLATGLLLGAAAGAFVSTFIILLDLPPTLENLGLALNGIVIAASMLLGLLVTLLLRKNMVGLCTIDTRKSLIHLRIKRRTESIPFSRIHSIYISRTPSQKPDPHDPNTPLALFIEWQSNTGTISRTCLGTWRKHEKTLRLQQWLHSTTHTAESS